MKDFINLEPNVQLNRVMKFLYWSPNQSPHDLALHFYPPNEKSIIKGVAEMTDIMEFLVDEKYAIKGQGTYKLTFLGKVFIMEEGGYITAKKMAEAKEAKQDELIERGAKTAERLNSLTFWLAVGTIALFVLELVKFIIEHPSLF